MLKITYLEDGIYLEYLSESLKTWTDRRILVSLRATANIYIKASTACLTLAADPLYFSDLQALQAREIIEVTPCDEEYVEVSFQGTWIATHQDSEEGVFVCDLSNSHEFFIYKLWQESQIGSSVMSE